MNHVLSELETQQQRQTVTNDAAFLLQLRHLTGGGAPPEDLTINKPKSQQQTPDAAVDPVLGLLSLSSPVVSGGVEQKIAAVAAAASISPESPSKSTSDADVALILAGMDSMHNYQKTATDAY